MRDRIARFQASASSEAPLIPRSSFGAPTPNPDVLKSAKRHAFPGAQATKGTGNWGETLRPQLTGGWLQVGGYGNSHAGVDGEMRPQLTGGLWGSPKYSTGRGGESSGAFYYKLDHFADRYTSLGSPFPAAAPPISPTGPKTLGGGTDAFAELDGEAETETARYYRTQREKAAREGSTSSDKAEREGLEEMADVGGALPQFPKTPETEVDMDEAKLAKSLEKESSSASSESDLEVRLSIRRDFVPKAANKLTRLSPLSRPSHCRQYLLTHQEGRIQATRNRVVRLRVVAMV